MHETITIIIFICVALPHSKCLRWDNNQKTKKKTRSANKTSALTRNYDVWCVCVVSDERQQTDNDERLMQFFMCVLHSRCVLTSYFITQTIHFNLFGKSPSTNTHTNRAQFFTLIPKKHQISTVRWTRPGKNCIKTISVIKTIDEKKDCQSAVRTQLTNHRLGANTVVTIKN